MKLLLAILLIGAVLILVGSCMTFRDSDKALTKAMENSQKPFEIRYLNSGSKKIRYLYFQNEAAGKPLLFIVHGAPGSSSNFQSFIENDTLRSQYSILLIDRLGYGYSEFGKYHTIKEQATAIEKVIEEVGASEVILMGHSFGGSIVGYMATQNPSWLLATVMIAPAIDPEKEKYFWFGKIGYYKLTRWMAPKSLRVAASEKYNHVEELKEFESDWGSILKPILHIHGDKDALVPFQNLAFSKNNIPEEVLTPQSWEGHNHFIPFRNADQLIDSLQVFLSEVKR
jgi:pimeloyl-ACP methyl ester carboxylesterase